MSALSTENKYSITKIRTGNNILVYNKVSSNKVLFFKGYDTKSLTFECIFKFYMIQF